MLGLRRIIALLATVSLAAGCTAIPGHRGYLNDEFLIQSVQPGVDNQQSVERALGHPTMKSQFGEPVWYYVSSTTAQKPFTTPRITQHSVLAVKFDQAGNVSSVQRTGMEQVARIDPDSHKTPTLGRERTFLQDLFGNIGQVGAGAGAGGQGGGNQGN